MNPQPEQKYFIVYADDDEDDLFFVQEAFENLSEPVEVITFPGGIEALQFLRTLPDGHNAPCLVILDINMPRMNGKEVLQELRRLDRFAHVPVVLFSTSAQPQDAAFAQQHGVVLITKPVDFRDMDGIAKRFVSHCVQDGA